MMKTRWVKAYKGPFQKCEAQAIVDQRNGTMYEAKVRKRPGRKSHCVCTAACGAGLGHNQKYDVYIKIERTDD